MQLVILDYEFGTVQIIRNVPEDIEDYEDFVYNVLNYKKSEISWMLVEDDFRTLYYTYNERVNAAVYDNDNLLNYD